MSKEWYEHDRAYVRDAKKPYCAQLPDPNPSYEELARQYLSARDLDYEVAKANGWYASSTAGDYSPRVVIPAFSFQDGNHYWQARAISADGGISAALGESIRYQSPHAVSRGDANVLVFPPSEIEQGLSLGVGWVVVEGPMDALAAAGVGFVGLALMGAVPPGETLSAAVRVVGNGPVWVVADEGALGAFTAVWRHFPGAVLRTTYPWKDLAEVPSWERKGIILG